MTPRLLTSEEARTYCGGVDRRTKERDELRALFGFSPLPPPIARETVGDNLSKGARW